MRKRWIGITCACVAFMMVTVVLSVLIFNFRHKHQLSDAKIYHIYNDHITYTQKCVKDKYTQSFETDKTFTEVIASVSDKDKIVLEEDITLSTIIKISPTVSQTENSNKNVNINIDLNNKTIQSMFELNATYGDIKFNISNGVVDSAFVNAIKVSGINGKAEINISNVQCYSTGDKNAPLYIEDVYKVSVSARNSKFVSKNSLSEYSSYGVGVFINNDGDFNFENCTLDGGDGLHVRRGTISLKNCNLVNTGLISQDYQSLSKGFRAVGASLATNCYVTGAGSTNFEITVENCVMITNNSNRVIYVYKTAQSGYEDSVNYSSFIDIVSCKFDENPNEFANFDMIRYSNGGSPVNNGNGYWVYGNVTK